MNAASASRPAFLGSPGLLAYVELAKPGIALVVLMTAAAGYVAGAAGPIRFLPMAVCLGGTALAAAGAGALNMLLERDTDAQMERTRSRPLPAGRLSPAQALAFGAGAGVAGVAALSVLCNPAAGTAAAVSLSLYLFLYTPLKRVTPWCMLPGSIAGALPPLIGVSAAAGQPDARGLTLFAVLFLWQFPHILSLGWLYRDDYARASLRVLPSGPRARAHIAFVAASSSLLLIPASILPLDFGLAGPVYGCGAAVLGAVYCASALRFGVRQDRASAKALFLASIAYVPTLLLLLAVGR